MMASITTSKAASTGKSNDRMDNRIAPIHSPVESTGFATPPVVVVDSPRAATLLICTAPAVPPPTIIAAAQAANWDISPLLAAIVIKVPASMAAGVAIVSMALSTQEYNTQRFHRGSRWLKPDKLPAWPAIQNRSSVQTSPSMQQYSSPVKAQNTETTGCSQADTDI